MHALYKLRKKLGISLNQLSLATGLARGTLRRAEAGRGSQVDTVAILIAWAAARGETLQWGDFVTHKGVKKVKALARASTDPT